jgi:hypothetical protein
MGEDLRCWIREKLIQDQDPGANKAPDHGFASATLLLTIVYFKYGNKVPYRNNMVRFIAGIYVRYLHLKK